MIELDQKYVFHVPLFKFVADELIAIDIDDSIGELLEEFERNGFDGLYFTKIKSYYKSRCYDELLITVFASSLNRPEVIFKNWFTRNNGIFQQEAMAFECNNVMHIENL